MSGDITLKIHRGTGKLTGTPLCYSCKHAMIRDEDIFCGWSEPMMVITKPVRSCNRYYNRTLPSTYDMEKIAWELKTDEGGRKIGFKPPKKED